MKAREQSLSLYSLLPALLLALPFTAVSRAQPGGGVGSSQLSIAPTPLETEQKNIGSEVVNTDIYGNAIGPDGNPIPADQSSGKGKPDPIPQGQSANEANSVAKNGLDETNNEKKNAIKGIRNANTAAREGITHAVKTQASRIKSAPPGLGQERAAILKDQEIINNFKKNLEKGKPNSEEEAKKAEHPQIRKDLLLVAKAQKEEEYYKREEARLTDQIAKLAGLAAAAAQIANNLGETQAPKSARSAGNSGHQATQTSNVSALPAESKTGGADTSIKVDAEAKSAEMEKEKSALLKELDGDSKAIAKLAKDTSLRDSLRKKLLAQKESGNASPGNSGFGEGTDGSGQEGSTNKVIAEALSSGPAENSSVSSPGGGSSFSLRNAETDAAVKQMTDEAQRALSAAEDQKAGILATDTSSLFERITSHLQACLRQRCVNSNFLPKN